MEDLQRTINAQAGLISSQTEMLKEINKKMLENEQKVVDFLHAKGVVCNKRHPDDHLNDTTNPDEPSAKKFKLG